MAADPLRAAASICAEFDFTLPQALFCDGVPRFHRAMAVGFAMRFPDMFSVVVPVLGMSAAEPMVERGAARLWDTIGIYRWNLREDLVQALGMLETWEFAPLVMYRILGRFCAISRRGHASSH
jgi:hypothetical protein